MPEPAPQVDLRDENRRALDGRRLFAALFDGLLALPLVWAAVWAWGGFLAPYALFVCLQLLLHQVCEVTTGATPGKRIFGLRLARLRDGALPAPREVAVRGIVGIFEFVPIALLALVWTKGRRRLADRAAGTVVIDARKHPIAPRRLFTGALAYPAVWAALAIVACVVGARGVLPDSYRARADSWCWVFAPEPGAGMPTGSMDLAAASMTVSSLQMLTPPHAWRDEHADLLRRLQLRAAEHERWAEDRRRHPGRATDAAWRARDRQARAADDAALAAEGFHDCAHSA